MFVPNAHLEDRVNRNIVRSEIEGGVFLEELQKASPNKGGHREKAIELTRQAISQVEEGIQYFNTHKGK